MCKCLEKMNERLKSRGLEMEGIYDGFGINFDTGKVNFYTSLCTTAREPSKGRGKKRETVPLVLSYCPFCGEKRT